MQVQIEDEELSSLEPHQLEELKRKFLIEKATNDKAWSKQETESDKEWERFVYYRDLGPKRNLEAVASHFNKSQLTIYHVSCERKWRARVNAYDRHMDDVVIKAQEEAIKEQNRRHATHGQAIEDVTMRIVHALLNKFKSNPNALENKSESELFEMLKEAVPGWAKATDIERRARGEATEIIKNTGQRDVIVIKPHYQPPSFDAEDSEDDE